MSAVHHKAHVQARRRGHAALGAAGRFTPRERHAVGEAVVKRLQAGGEQAFPGEPAALSWFQARRHLRD